MARAIDSNRCVKDPVKEKCKEIQLEMPAPGERYPRFGRV